MTSKIYIITGLGPGDDGKGGVVHKIATMTNAHTIIKRGGAQGSHGVRTSKGEQFAFSQWGCGTLNGIPTHITAQLVVSPIGLINEANALHSRCGINNPFDLLTVDKNALCATPFHGIASHLNEMARGNNPRGTIGTGVGVSYRDYKRVPEIAIKVRDLKKSNIKERLAAIRSDVQDKLQPIIQGKFLDSDQEQRDREIELLYDDNYLDYIAKKFYEIAGKVNIVGHDYLGDEILSRDGVAVVETSHGVLTDRVVGFSPHTSAIRTLPCFTHKLLEEAGYTGQIINIGVTRAYAFRHGAGPMPTADPKMNEYLLPGSSKDENRFQGKVRVGPLDLVLLRYAIEACGGPASFDGLAITWFDQITANGRWDICNKYSDINASVFFDPEGNIKTNHKMREVLTEKLLKCYPKITHKLIDSNASKDELYAVCAETMKELVKVPVRMVSFGPTEMDKVCK